MTPNTIAMLSAYQGLDQADWLWKQTPHPFGRWGSIQLQATAPHPDYLLLYQFDFHQWLDPPPKTRSQQLMHHLRQLTHSPSPQLPGPGLPQQFRQVPKDRILFLLREPPLPEVLPQNLKNYAYAQQFCGYVSGPDDHAPTPAPMPAIWYVNRSFKELKEAPPPEKLRPCSWITSGINRTASHRQRLAFLRSLQESGCKVDIYGRDLPDWVNGFGPLSNKWSGMAPYHYNLAIENYADNAWYISEKLWDALLSWCLPIYYGGSAADGLLPPGSFLRLPSLDQNGIRYIQDVIASPDAWYEAQPAIAAARQVILHELNLINWLDRQVRSESP